MASEQDRCVLDGEGVEPESEDRDGGRGEDVVCTTSSDRV